LLSSFCAFDEKPAYRPICVYESMRRAAELCESMVIDPRNAIMHSTHHDTQVDAALFDKNKHYTNEF